MTEEELQDIADTYGLYTDKEVKNKIADLEKENAKLKARSDYWKDSSFSWRHRCFSRIPVKVAVQAQKQLREAKELLKNFVALDKDMDWNLQLAYDAEQFIKDSEVEK